MKPEIPKVLEVVAAKLIFEVAPSVTPSYRQSSIGVTAMLLGIVREEWDRAAARRVEENASLRALFGEAASVVTDTDLRHRIEAAAASSDASLLVSELEKSNDALRALLIDLHAQVEEQSGAASRALEDAIWRELSASTERRKLSMAPF
ncbi:MAG: hypothetical protein WEF50_12460 [Myxococcota bacterium]